MSGSLSCAATGPAATSSSPSAAARKLAGLLLGDGKIALVNLGTIDRGDERVLVLRCDRAGRYQQQPQRGGKETGPAGEKGDRHGAVLGNGMVRKRSGRRRTCRPTAMALQWRTGLDGLT